MYIYEIGYHSCEDSSYGQWYHENQYTEEQLLELVIEGLKVARDAWWISERKFRVENPPQSDYEKRHLEERGPCFDELLTHQPVFCEYLKSIGFVRMKKEATVSLFGWARAEVPGDWSCDASEPTGYAQIKLAGHEPQEPF